MRHRGDALLAPASLQDSVWESCVLEGKDGLLLEEMRGGRMPLVATLIPIAKEKREKWLELAQMGPP